MVGRWCKCLRRAANIYSEQNRVTAPRLFTAANSNYWVLQDGQLALMEPTASLAVLIYNFAGSPYDNQVELAWAAALALVLIVLTFNIAGQLLSRSKHSK